MQAGIQETATLKSDETGPDASLIRGTPGSRCLRKVLQGSAASRVSLSGQTSGVTRRAEPKARGRSVVAIDPLIALMPLLRLERQGGDGTRLEPTQRNRLTGLLAIAIAAIDNPTQRRVDLGNQFALEIGRAHV